MPIVDVTYGPQAGAAWLFQLGRMLLHEVSVAVECPDELYDWSLQPGDVEIQVEWWKAGAAPRLALASCLP
jgi:hypothetical protein